MSKVQVFDPPTCCSTGVCGPEVDPALVRFASDLEWRESNGAAAPKSIYGEAVDELVAIGAAIASSCEPCFRHHFDRARKLGVSKEDMARAVTTAKMVKESPARAVVELAERYLGTKIATKEGPDECRAPPDAARVAPGGSAPSPKTCR